MQACKEILLALLDGVVDANARSKIHVLDLMPNRLPLSALFFQARGRSCPSASVRSSVVYVRESFLGACRYNEWGRAVANFQMSSLSTDQGHSWFFTAYYTDDELRECTNLHSDMAASFLSAAASH